MANFLKNLWNKIKEIDGELTFCLGILGFVVAGVFGTLLIWNKLSFSWAVFILSFLFLISIWISKNAFSLFKIRKLKLELEWYEHKIDKLIEQFDESVKVCGQWQKHAKDWEEYANKVKQTYTGTAHTIMVATESSELMSQQMAVLSNLVQNVVHAPTIKTLMELSRTLDNQNTIILTQIDHERSRWNVSVTGRSIELEQALHLMESVKEKLRDFAENNSLVKKTNKIQN